jgi:hypothetical protein
MSAGAKFIVIRLRGIAILLLAKALRTRSRDSSTALLPRPTIVMPGRPLESWHSVSMTMPDEPKCRTVCMGFGTFLIVLLVRKKVKARQFGLAGCFWFGFGGLRCLL